MKKALKKVMALSLAAMTTGVLATSASATEVEIERKLWSVTDVNVPGAPSISADTTNVYLTAAYDFYAAEVTEMTNIVNRSVTITCASNTMVPNPHTFNQTGIPQSWKLSGDLVSEDICYTVTAHTSLSTTLHAEGYIRRYIIK